MILTDSEVQEKLRRGLALLEERNSTEEVSIPRVILQYFLEYSKSGNRIPALRGQGLEEVLSFVTELEENPTAPTRIHAKQLAKALTLKS